MIKKNNRNNNLQNENYNILHQRKKNKSIWEKTKQDEKTQVDMKFHTSNIENHSFIKKIKIK